jgi:hypothetical protein
MVDSDLRGAGELCIRLAPCDWLRGLSGLACTRDCRGAGVPDCCGVLARRSVTVAGDWFIRLDSRSDEAGALRLAGAFSETPVRAERC